MVITPYPWSSAYLSVCFPVLPVGPSRRRVLFFLAPLLPAAAAAAVAKGFSSVLMLLSLQGGQEGRKQKGNQAFALRLC